MPGAHTHRLRVRLDELSTPQTGCTAAVIGPTQRRRLAAEHLSEIADHNRPPSSIRPAAQATSWSDIGKEYGRRRPRKSGFVPEPSHHTGFKPGLQAFHAAGPQRRGRGPKRRAQEPPAARSPPITCCWCSLTRPLATALLQQQEIATLRTAVTLPGDPPSRLEAVSSAARRARSSSSPSARRFGCFVSGPNTCCC